MTHLDDVSEEKSTFFFFYNSLTNFFEIHKLFSHFSCLFVIPCACLLTLNFMGLSFSSGWKKKALVSWMHNRVWFCDNSLVVMWKNITLGFGCFLCFKVMPGILVLDQNRQHGRICSYFVNNLLQLLFIITFTKLSHLNAI